MRNFDEDEKDRENVHEARMQEGKGPKEVQGQQARM